MSDSQTGRTARRMTEYIEREKVLAVIQSRRSPTRSPAQNEMLRTIRVDVNHIRAADVAPVVHGYRAPAEQPKTVLLDSKCVECEALLLSTDKYCPNCGAMMEDKA